MYTLYSSCITFTERPEPPVFLENTLKIATWSVVISWNHDPKCFAGSYCNLIFIIEVYRHNSPIQTLQTVNTFHAVYGLQPGTTYVILLYAKCSKIESIRSESVNISVTTAGKFTLTFIILYTCHVMDLPLETLNPENPNLMVHSDTKYACINHNYLIKCQHPPVDATLKERPVFGASGPDWTENDQVLTTDGDIFQVHAITSYETALQIRLDKYRFHQQQYTFACSLRLHKGGVLRSNSLVVRIIGLFTYNMQLH